MSITLRFVTSGFEDGVISGLISKTIRGAEFGFWASHVEALMPNGMLLGAHGDGVTAVPRDYDKGKFSQELYVEVPCTDDQAAAFYAFLRSKLKLPYDYEAIGEMAVGVLSGEAPDWQSSPSYICSALQTAALLTAGIIKGAPATVRLATPRDVLVACAALTTIGDPREARRD